MTRGAVEECIHEEIPLSAAMGTQVVVATPESVVLAAPLAPNVNHRATAFGGSVAALALLAGWTLVDLRLRGTDIRAHTVVQTGDIHFLAPAKTGLEARAFPPEEEAWRRFLTTLERWGRARLRLRVEVHSGGERVATLDAAYVSLTNGE
jgi:thioesterase domain-containing protein